MNARRAALRIFSGKIFIIEQCRAVCGPPGIAFSRVGSQRKTAVAALVSCGNSRAAVSVLALSVIAARCQIPPFVAYATSSPGAGEVFPHRESLWQNWKVCRTAKASPFGRGGCDQREQTERASPLAAAPRFRRKRRCRCRLPPRPTREKVVPKRPQTFRNYQ